MRAIMPTIPSPTTGGSFTTFDRRAPESTRPTEENIINRVGNHSSSSSNSLGNPSDTTSYPTGLSTYPTGPSTYPTPTGLSSSTPTTYHGVLISGDPPSASAAMNTVWVQCGIGAAMASRTYQYSAGGVPTCSFHPPPTVDTLTSGSIVTATSTSTRPAGAPAKVENKGALAAAGVLAVLFVAALAAAAFLGILYRRLKKRTKAEPQYADYNGDPEPRNLSQVFELQARTAELTAALQSRDLQADALRGRLLNPQDPSPNALDDNAINARFARLDQDVKDWVINYFRGGGSGENRVMIGEELGKILIAQVPMFDRLLQQPKTKTLVLRAVVASVLQRAFGTGEFLGIGAGLEVLGGTMEANTSPQEFNKWRSQTFQLLSRSASPSAKSHVITTLTRYIDGLLTPFLTPAGSSSTPPITAQERLQSLASIIEFFVSLSTDLSSQIARFKIILDKPETPFVPETMDDVYQANETRVDHASGVAVNALNGKPILAVVFPSVVKWGNELGEGFDVASVIVKARVLT